MDTDVADKLPILHGVTPNDFVILVSHKPDYFPKISRSWVDLVLSRHAQRSDCILWTLRTIYKF
jgi:predicted MPP superfamily phosphohydrolase